MNMIEKVARNIYECSPALNNFGADIISWDELQGPLKEICTLQAKAAIEPMRVPTKEMLIAYNNNSSHDDFELFAYEAMIDAALKE